jgi:hypothetical protein
VSRRRLWWVAKALEGIGLLVVLVGVFWSISLGLEDEGLGSMRAEMNGLLIGGGLFLSGWLLERRIARG